MLKSSTCGPVVHSGGAHQADDQRAQCRSWQAAEAANDDDRKRQHDHLNAHRRYDRNFGRDQPAFLTELSASGLRSSESCFVRTTS